MIKCTSLQFIDIWNLFEIFWNPGIFLKFVIFSYQNGYQILNEIIHLFYLVFVFPLLGWLCPDKANKNVKNKLIWTVILDVIPQQEKVKSTLIRIVKCKFIENLPNDCKWKLQLILKIIWWL
jgi:hypothetical protein